MKPNNNDVTVSFPALSPEEIIVHTARLSPLEEETGEEKAPPGALTCIEEGALLLNDLSDPVGAVRTWSIKALFRSLRRWRDR